ncbi:hypothetical protein, partial [Aeromonas allosaccharophila]|uniref:hypothetical protein n=1 Tax=Aeromonas allosaccharophila TaxID=656 RepID=UPI0035B83737
GHSLFYICRTDIRERYVQEVADGFCCVEWRAQEGKTTVVGMGLVTDGGLLWLPGWGLPNGG